MKIFLQCPKNSSSITSRTQMSKSLTSTLWGPSTLKLSASDMNQTTSTLPKDAVMEVSGSSTLSQVSSLTPWIQIWRRQCQPLRSGGDQLKVWLLPRTSSFLLTPTVHFSTGTPLQANYCIPYIQVSEISSSRVITTMMEHNFVQVASHGLSQFMMSRQGSKLLILKEVVLVSQATVTEFSVSNSTKMIQI